MSIEQSEFTHSVLIASNDNELLEEMEASLRKLHLSVFTAYSAAESLSVFKARMTSIVVLALKGSESNSNALRKILRLLETEHLDPKSIPQIISIKNALGSGRKMKVENLVGTEHEHSEFYSSVKLASQVRKAFDRTGHPIVT